MFYLKINYIFHLILNSKYKIVLSFILYFVFYCIIKNNSLAFCMTNDFDGINTNSENQQMYDLRKEIKSFAGSQAYLLEQAEMQTQTIVEQKEKIETLTNAIEGEPKTRVAYDGRLRTYRGGGYKQEIGTLQYELDVLKNRFAGLEKELNKSQILLEEYRRSRPL